MPPKKVTENWTPSAIFFPVPLQKVTRKEKVGIFEFKMLQGPELFKRILTHLLYFAPFVEMIVAVPLTSLMS
jgi:hypothetical protein